MHMSVCGYVCACAFGCPWKTERPWTPRVIGSCKLHERMLRISLGTSEIAASMLNHPSSPHEIFSNPLELTALEMQLLSLSMCTTSINQGKQWFYFQVKIQCTAGCNRLGRNNTWNPSPFWLLAAMFPAIIYLSSLPQWQLFREPDLLITPPPPCITFIPMS